jgi:hypothetical protein
VILQFLVWSPGLARPAAGIAGTHLVSARMIRPF